MYNIVIPRYDNPYLLPKDCIPISNSEVRESWCKRKWLLSYGYLLDKEIKATSPLAFGALFHEVIEYVHREWMKAPKEISENKLISFINSSLVTAVKEYNANSEELSEIKSRLIDSCMGYLNILGLPDGYNIVAVEQELCFPFTDEYGEIIKANCIFNKTGEYFRLNSPLVDEKETFFKQLPLYHIGKMDFILQNKETGRLLIGEMKTSSQPENYSYMFHIDPQISAYRQMLEYAIENGWAEKNGISGVPKDDPIEGYVTEFIYSKKTRDPKKLSKGDFSKSKSERVPSWKYLKSLKDNGLPVEDYKEHIQHLKLNVDSKYYIRKYGTFSNEMKNTFFFHQLSNGLKFKNMIEAFSNSRESENQYVHLEKNFHRTQYCRSSYGCKFYEICQTHITKNNLDSFGYKNRDTTTWKKE